ncbi:MAG: lipopolysaccharide biosynthesis protein [Ferruginibacter sp.]
MSIKQKAANGIFWTFIDMFFTRGISIAASLLLAKMLGPYAFGLMGMINVFILIGGILVDAGLTTSLIRTGNAGEKDYSTVFFANILFSIFIYLVIFMAAPLIAAFYGQQILVSLIRTTCLIFIIGAFSAVQVAQFNKKMDFKTLALINIPSTIIGVAVGLIMAYKGYNVWSIVFMQLAMQASNTIVTWFVSKWKPAMVFSGEKLREHVRFGYKLTLTSLLGTIFDNLYNIFIGKFYSVKELGYYERSNTFIGYPVIILSGIVGKVSYPLLSHMQDDPLMVERVYKKILNITFFVSAPLMVCLVAVARPLFLLLLGASWEPMVPYFQILALAAMLYPLHAFNINVLRVKGETGLLLRMEFLKRIILCVLIVFSIRMGIYWLLWSSVLYSVICFFINAFNCGKFINYRVWEQLGDVTPTILASLVMFVTMFFLQQVLGHLPLWVQIALPVVAGGCSYLLLNYFINRSAVKFFLSAAVIAKQQLGFK